MLIIKAYVNDRQIDELWIHNLGSADPAKRKYPELMLLKDQDDLCLYQIEKPDGYMKSEYRIKHKRSDGWEKLVRKACEVIGIKKYEEYY